MSYILDALRRADAERERGKVPGLHGDAASLPSADDEPDVRPHPALWGAATLLLLLACGGIWYGLGSNRPAETPPPATRPVAPPAPPPATPATAAPVPPASTAPVAPATPIPVPSPATLPAPVSTQPRPAPAAAPSAAPTAEPRIPLLTELPDAIRRELPPLATSGAMYSETPANRMLIINGQLFHEGDTVAPNLVLEQIRLKGAVLSYRDSRFRITY